MSRFDERIERDLHHIADKATPSSTAWEAIQTRVAEQADHPELEITMLKPNPTPDRSIRTWMLGAAAAVVLIIGGLYVALSGGGDNESPLEVVTDPTPTAPTSAPTTTPATTEAPTTTLPREVSAEALATIEAYLAATDMATLSTIVTPTAIAASTESALMANADEWLVARKSIGVEVDVLSCLEVVADVSIRCQVSIRSPLSEAFGREPRQRGVSFDFTDGGLIDNWPGVIAGPDFDETREAAVAAGFGDEIDAVCLELTTECADFLVANVDTWAEAAG